MYIGVACIGRGYVTIVGRKRLWSDHLGRGYVTIHEQSLSQSLTVKGRYRAARAAKNIQSQIPKGLLKVRESKIE